MQLDKQLTTILVTGMAVILAVAAIQAPLAQTTTAPVMELGSAYALSLENYSSEYLQFLARTANTTTGSELSGFSLVSEKNTGSNGNGELFVVENNGSKLGGIYQGILTTQPGSFYNYSATTWYNTTGEIFNDNFSDPLDGSVSSFSKDFTATYNDTYAILFDGLLMDSVPLGVVEQVFAEIPYLGFNLGYMLHDQNTSMIPKAQLWVNNLTLLWNGQNSTFTVVEATYNLQFDFTDIISFMEIPGTYTDEFILNATGYVSYSLSALYNKTNGMLVSIYESYAIEIMTVGSSYQPLSTSSSANTDFTTYYYTTNALMANVTEANFGLGNPTPSIDPNYPFNYSDTIIYLVDDYVYGYQLSAIRDASGTALNIFEGIYSESAMGEMLLSFAYTDSGISLNTLLNQMYAGYATYGVSYEGDRTIDGSENVGFMDSNGTFLWYNDTVYHESYMESDYDKLVVPYNATHPIIGEYPLYIDFFEDYSAGMDLPFTEFIYNSTVPLTSVTSYTYNLPIDINGNTNMYINALEVVAFYGRNWTSSAINYVIPEIDGTFNITVSIYFWYAEYYTYDTNDGMLLLADQYSGFNVTVAGPGSVFIPWQNGSVDVTLDFELILSQDTQRTLDTVPYYYPYTPTNTTTPTPTPTNTTTNTTTTNNTGIPSSATPTSPAAPTFLPGFEIYVTATAIFVPVAITIIRRKR